MVGADLLVEDLGSIIYDIKDRNGGQVFLFYIETGSVVAGPQPFNGTVETITEMPLPGSTLTIGSLSGTFGSQPRWPEGEGESGVTVDGGYQLVWQKLTGGQLGKADLSEYYCVLAITPLEAITAPIDDQITTIDNEADSLALTVVIICLVFFALILSCSCCVALQMSAPLVATSSQSTKIIENIGGDLFDGITVYQSDVENCGCLRGARRAAHGLQRATGLRGVAEYEEPDAFGTVVTKEEPSAALPALLIDQPGEVAALRGQASVKRAFGLGPSPRHATSAPPRLRAPAVGLTMQSPHAAASHDVASPRCLAVCRYAF